MSSGYNLDGNFHKEVDLNQFNKDDLRMLRMLEIVKNIKNVKKNF